MKRGQSRNNDKIHRQIWGCQTTWPRKFSALHHYKTHDFSDVDPPKERDAQTISLQHLPVRKRTLHLPLTRSDRALLTYHRARRRKCIYPTTERSDRVIACEFCRSRALHCVQRPPEGGYYAQRQARIEEFEAAQQASASPQGQLTPASCQSPSDLPPMPLRLELVSLYFDYIHDQFHSMYHRPSFTEDVARERVPRIILLAIFALSCR